MPHKINLQTALQEASAQVETAMRTELEHLEDLEELDARLKEVLEYALFGGGKRVRPFLAITVSRSFGRDDEDLYNLAAALEYLHTATLMHDDVIDHAPLRRGRESTVQRFSLEDAILAGDWLHAHSLHLVGRLTGAAGLAIFCTATEGMVNGEFVQKRLAGNSASTEADYLRVIRYKTGNLIASACALGALYGGAKKEAVEAFRSYGALVGMAFQIADDILDYTGNETGKELGNDFREGKFTLPLLRALAQAGDEDRAAMLRLIGHERETEGAAMRMREYIERLGAFRSAAEQAERYASEAVHEIVSYASQPEAALHLALLADLAAYVVNREK